MNPATMRILGKVLKYTAGTAMAGGSIGVLHGFGSQYMAGRAAADTLRNLPVEPYWKLRLTGRIPLHSKVLTDPEEIADYAVKDIPADSFARKMIRRSVLNGMAKKVSEGENAAYVGTSHMRPVFFGGKRGMNPTVASHETGHYRAARRHGMLKYMQNYQKAMSRIPRPGDMLEKNMWKDNGADSLPGIEREAWELGPGSQDPAIKEVTLNTYKTQRRGAAETTYGNAALWGGIALKLLTRGKFRG